MAWQGASQTLSLNKAIRFLQQLFHSQRGVSSRAPGRLCPHALPRRSPRSPGKSPPPSHPRLQGPHPPTVFGKLRVRKLPTPSLVPARRPDSAVSAATEARCSRLIAAMATTATEGSGCKFLHTTLSRKGLEEFFDDPKNWGEEKVKSGASWTCQQLRNKSNEDLHKLWYVLLKERNMLLTLEQEAKRQRLPMPSPERLEKVVDSMDALDKVVQEREDALRLLQTG